MTSKIEFSFFCIQSGCEDRYFKPPILGSIVLCYPENGRIKAILEEYL
jgi:hypothetical protein